MNRKSYCLPALIISTLIFSTLTFLTSCSSSSTTTTTPPPTVTITATGSTTPQSVAVGTAFTALQATVTTGGTATSGVTVTFTAPTTEPNGTFAGGVATATATTNSSGVATSPAFTAGTTAGTYTVTASAPGTTATAGFSLTNTAGAAANLAATSGGGQIATVSTAFPNPLVATVTDSDGNGVMGISVTFVAPAVGASGLFADGGTPAASDMVMTDANGKATSTTFTANATAGGPYNVVGSSNGLAPVNFGLTNVPVTTTALAPGNYVFSLTGADANGNGTYTVAGVFTVNGVGAITGGEQDFSDFNVYEHDRITSGGIAASADGNLIITLNTGDIHVGVNGTETLDATLVSSSKALITEFDASASSSGELDLQATGLTTPSGGLAFFLLGLDSTDNPLAVGGIINVDNSGGAGGISGTGSVFDINDNGAPLAKQSFTPSAVTAPDALGLVTFTLNNSVAGVGEITLVGYMVDASHIRLVENYSVDLLSGTTGGTALGQGASTGGFTTSSIEGKSFVFGTAGYDFVTGGLDVAGIVTANANGTTVGGNLSFNDITTHNAQGGTAITGGTYTVDSTGRVTATGVTDGATFTYNLQIYLDGNGNGQVISMDTADVLAGPGVGQTSGSFTAASFSGNYAVDLTTLVPSGGFLFEQDGVGTVAADGVGKLTGFLDVNESSGVPVPDLAVSNSTFAVTATNGVFTGTITDPVSGNADAFTYYLADTTTVVAIENDASQLTLGLFELQ